MKRNTMRMLSLLLTLVMLLGAVPFAAAATPVATIEVYPNDTVWEGTEVDLMLVAPTGYSLSGIAWNTKQTTDTISVTPSKTTTYTVQYDLNGATPVVDKELSKTITVWEKAKQGTFAINAASTAYIGEEVALTLVGKGDSDVEFSVNKAGATVTDGKFVATANGTYEVTAVAENDPDANDEVTAKATITVSEATAKVTVTNKTVSLNEKNTYVTYTAKKGSATVTPTSVSYSVVSGSSVTVGASTGLITPKAEGVTTVKVTAVIDGETVSGTGTITVSASGVVYLEQDGEATDDDSIDLEFSVVGPDKKDEVEWTFEVRALNIKNSTDKSSPYFTWKDSKETDKRNYDVEEDGPEIELELVAKKGYGIAMITASANWTGGSKADAEGTFYVSFYDEVDIEVKLNDDVDEFDWDEEGVFSSVKVGTSTYTATQLKTANLAEILTLEAGNWIDLDEGKEADDNEDVGTIEGSKSVDYNPDEVNDIEMDDLDNLTFEVEDEGTYVIDYVQYDKVSGYGSELIIGEGTLEITVGEGTGKTKKGDVNYDVKNKDEVSLDEDDFEEYWEDEDMDDDFGYVIFDGYKSTKIYGTFSAEDGDEDMKNSYKFHFDYDKKEDDGNKDFDLDELLYEAASNKSNYVDEIDFTCYSEDGKEELEGTLTFTVGTGEEEEEEETTLDAMAFTDVKSSDWFYDAVKYVYEKEIMAGTTKTQFSPNTNLNRGMIVTMLYRVEGQPTVTATNKFTDVKTTDYYYDAVRWAAQNGIVTGTTNTTFAPTNNITRQDLATILYRYVKNYKGQTASLGTLTGFADASTVANYASDAMKWAVGKGIINGISGNLQPYGNATRAQAATMFQRLLAN